VYAQEGTPIVTAEELTVAITSVGANEVQSDLEGVEDSMEDTADSAGNSAEELQGFSEMFKGAMATTVAALATAAAGLLAQVPVVGEVASGFGAILNSIIRQMDDDMRPALSGLRDDLFGVANVVEKADGTFEALSLAVLGVKKSIEQFSIDAIQRQINELIGVEVPSDWLEFGLETLTGDFDSAARILNRIVDEDIVPPINNKIGEIKKSAKNVWNGIVSDVKTFAGNMKTKIQNEISNVKTDFDNLASDLNSWGSDLASDALDWGKDLVDELAAGIEQKISEVENAAKKVATAIDEYMPGSPADTGPLSDLDESGPGLVDELASGMRSGVGEVQSAAGDVARGMDARGGGRRSFGGGGGGSQIDGRQLSESTGRYRSDPARRRGN